MFLSSLRDLKRLGRGLGFGASDAVLEHAPVLEVVEAAGGFDEAIGHDLGVAAAEGGVDAVTGFEFAEGREGGVVVAEEFDEGTGEFSGDGIGGEEGADPAIVGGETAAGGGDGAVEGADFVRFAHGGDDFLVFGDGEAGVATMGGVNESFEEGFAEGLVESGEDGAEFGEGGEGLEFARAEELDVPVFDA